MSNDLRERGLDQECLFTASRSSGPGGQNVNKVNTRVELRFKIGSSINLSDAEKEMIRVHLAGKINANDELTIVSQSERTQLKNKKRTLEKFFRLLEQAMYIPKKRIRTHPTQASVIKRLEMKRRHSEKKEGRMFKSED